MQSLVGGDVRLEGGQIVSQTRRHGDGVQPKPSINTQSQAKRDLILRTDSTLRRLS